ncbi:hypothetical protein GCM10023116_23370 [Kistimonas scapharcae]|uniref:Uncharacterized protein n=1 Tax=Kistimonas scapharcae TaxID=1036133 RepID=A0ABP8V3T5_9GAMM
MHGLDLPPPTPIVSNSIQLRKTPYELTNFRNIILSNFDHLTKPEQLEIASYKATNEKERFHLSLNEKQNRKHE